MPRGRALFSSALWNAADARAAPQGHPECARLWVRAGERDARLLKWPAGWTVNPERSQLDRLRPAEQAGEPVGTDLVRLGLADKQ